MSMKKILLLTFLTLCMGMAGCGKQEIGEVVKLEISDEIETNQKEDDNQKQAYHLLLYQSFSILSLP